MKRKDPVSIREILSEIIQRRGRFPTQDELRVWKIWDKVADPDIKENTKVLWIKDGKIRLAVRDSIWIQEIRFLERDLIHKINKRLGVNVIKKIEPILNSG